MMTLRPVGPSVTLTARASLRDAALHRLAGFLIERDLLGGHGSVTPSIRLFDSVGCQSFESRRMPVGARPVGLSR